VGVLRKSVNISRVRGRRSTDAGIGGSPAVGAMVDVVSTFLAGPGWNLLLAGVPSVRAARGLAALEDGVHMAHAGLGWASDLRLLGLPTVLANVPRMVGIRYELGAYAHERWQPQRPEGRHALREGAMPCPDQAEDEQVMQPHRVRTRFQFRPPEQRRPMRV
jgi:hypothetical protein